jgi:ADP-dependent NAD(P)H-hydrate dehydratase
MSRYLEVTPELLRARPLPGLKSGDKEQRGRVLVVAGSTELPGAALLTGTAALRAGAGKLQIATCRGVAIQVGVAVPEARVFAMPETETGAISPESASLLLSRANACSAVVVGPGMVDKDASITLTAALLDGVQGPPMVLDADAMAGLRLQRELLHRHRARVVITPHPGEMAGMMKLGRAEVEADPLKVARTAAAMLNVVVALKGSCTWIATPESDACVFRGGSIGLATSGSGDVLAGIIGGLIARGAEPMLATMWGIYLHGAAAQALAKTQGPVGFLARDLLLEVPRLMAELSDNREARDA